MSRSHSEMLKEMEEDMEILKYDKEIRITPSGVNYGTSNYSSMKIQPWDIMESMGMLEQYLIGDIIKRTMRSKTGERILDLEKIKHICDKLIELEKKK